MHAGEHLCCQGQTAHAHCLPWVPPMRHDTAMAFMVIHKLCIKLCASDKLLWGGTPVALPAFHFHSPRATHCCHPLSCPATVQTVAVAAVDFFDHLLTQINSIQVQCRTLSKMQQLKSGQARFKRIQTHMQAVKEACDAYKKPASELRIAMETMKLLGHESPQQKEYVQQWNKQYGMIM